MKKKTWEKPTVSSTEVDDSISRMVARNINKVEIDARILRMVSKRGFVEVLFEELIEQRKVNPKITEKEVFDYLNAEWTKVIHEPRYSSWDSFRQRANE